MRQPRDRITFVASVASNDVGEQFASVLCKIPYPCFFFFPLSLLSPPSANACICSMVSHICTPCPLRTSQRFRALRALAAQKMSSRVPRSRCAFFPTSRSPPVSSVRPFSSAFRGKTRFNRSNVIAKLRKLLPPMTITARIPPFLIATQTLTPTNVHASVQRLFFHG